MPNDDEKKLEKLSAIVEEFEDDDLDEEMTGKTQEERDKVLEREGTSRARAQAAHERALAKVRARAQELESAPSEAPEVKPASTQKPAPERSNVIDLTTYRRRVVRWAAGSGLGGIAIAAAVAAIYLDTAHMHVVPIPPPNSTAAAGGCETMSEAELHRLLGYEACFGGEYERCAIELDRAKKLDPDGELHIDVESARAYARAGLAKPR